MMLKSAVQKNNKHSKCTLYSTTNYLAQDSVTIYKNTLKI